MASHGPRLVAGNCWEIEIFLGPGMWVDIRAMCDLSCGGLGYKVNYKVI